MVCIYYCEACERNDHVHCDLTHASEPPGSYGGSRCWCQCQGNPHWNDPGIMHEELQRAIKKFIEFEKQSKWANKMVVGKQEKCNCTGDQCCDICTGWAEYVRKHGHPPKDKNVKSVSTKRPKKRKDRTSL